MGKIINWQFGDNLEFKHPICSDCKGNKFHVQISENDDVILHCVKCLNVIDFNLKFSSDYEALLAKLSRLVEALEAIRDYEPRFEVCYDEFAYKRIVEAYRNAARAALAAKEE